LFLSPADRPPVSTGLEKLNLLGCGVMERTGRISTSSLFLLLVMVLVAGCATPASHGTGTYRSVDAHRTVNGKGDAQEMVSLGDPDERVVEYSGEKRVQIAITRAEGTSNITQCQYRDGTVVQQTKTHPDGSKYVHEYRHKDGKLVQQTITHADGRREVIEYRYKDDKLAQQTITHADGSKDTRSMTDTTSAKNHSPLDWLFDKKAPSPVEWLLSQQSSTAEDWTFRRQAPPLDWIYTSDELCEISKDRNSYIDVSIDFP
jgi:hypothetical protein